MGSIRLITQIGKGVNDTSVLVVKNLAIDILFGTASIDANVKSISSRKQIIYLISSGPVAMQGFDHKDSPIAQVDDIAEHSLCCIKARTVRVLTVSQVPELI